MDRLSSETRCNSFRFDHRQHTVHRSNLPMLIRNTYTNPLPSHTHPPIRHEIAPHFRRFKYAVPQSMFQTLFADQICFQPRTEDRQGASTWRLLRTHDSTYGRSSNTATNFSCWSNSCKSTPTLRKCSNENLCAVPVVEVRFSPMISVCFAYSGTS